MRKGGLENLVLTGKIDGKRSRGRRRQLWTASLVEWIKERGVKNLTEMELLSKANDRELWHNMIAKVSWYGTERDQTMGLTVLYFVQINVRLGLSVSEWAFLC